MSAATAPVLRVGGLGVAFGRTKAVVVNNVSFEIEAGECLALVGESGSGKSVTARSLLGLAGDAGHVSADTLELNGRSLLELRPHQWRSVRGGEIGLVLQDALVSLDPLRPVGREIDDALRLHSTRSAAQRRKRVLELLAAVGMPHPAEQSRQRPGQLSGGLRQRALIASAIAAEPSLLIADEPTTALDVTVQAQILRLLGTLKEQGTALLLISHDLAVVQQVADRVAVMRAGEIVEQGVTRKILQAPAHAYTRQLLRSVPTGVPRGQPLSLPQSPAASASTRTVPKSSASVPNGAVLLEASGLVKTYPRGRHEVVTAVDDVSFTLQSGRTLGLVGESGSGKTTVARMLLGLASADSGHVLLDDAPWSELTERERRPRRASIGSVYQDALSSFDPRRTVGEILLDAVAIGGEHSGKARHGRVHDLLDAVSLERALLDRRPLHLSGGQRQRVSIARALAPAPRILICDEPVSALDVSVQAQVLDLLTQVQREMGLAYLFISHDLGVVQHMSDTVAVMQGGRIVEHNSAELLFADPQHEYTKQLLAATPRIDAHYRSPKEER